MPVPNQFTWAGINISTEPFWGDLTMPPLSLLWLDSLLRAH